MKTENYSMDIEEGDFTIYFHINDGKVNPHTIEKQDRDYNDIEFSAEENDILIADCQNYYNEMMSVKREFDAAKANGDTTNPYKALNP